MQKSLDPIGPRHAISRQAQAVHAAAVRWAAAAADLVDDVVPGAAAHRGPAAGAAAGHGRGRRGHAVKEAKSLAF